VDGEPAGPLLFEDYFEELGHVAFGEPVDQIVELREYRVF